MLLQSSWVRADGLEMSDEEENCKHLVEEEVVGEVVGGTDDRVVDEHEKSIDKEKTQDPEHTLHEPHY